MERERRAFMGEIRAADSEARAIEGYAAVFGSRTELGFFTEEVAPGAFDDVMGDDVRCLFNHDPDHILGRTSAKTLRLAQDTKGLRFTCDMPESPIGETVMGAVKRGDVTGNSFSFSIAEEQWDYEGQMPHRTILKVRQLYDVGPVTFPAYEATELSARTREAAAKEKPAAPPDFSRERERLRLLEAEA